MRDTGRTGDVPAESLDALTALIQAGRALDLPSGGRATVTYPWRGEASGAGLDAGGLDDRLVRSPRAGSPGGSRGLTI
jgi:hypothetical protein